MSGKTNISNSTRQLTFCALFAALSIVFTRLISYTPTPFQRYAINEVFIFLSGVFFGPLAGGLVGFGSDALGAILFSPFGYNPILGIPAILYGVVGGLVRTLLAKKFSFIRLSISFLIPAITGSILVQSAAMAYVYPQFPTYMESFAYFLLTRSVQYAIISVVDILIVYWLIRSGIFAKVNVWPPRQDEKATAVDGVIRILLAIVLLVLQVIAVIMMVNYNTLPKLDSSSMGALAYSVGNILGCYLVGICGLLLAVFGIRAYGKSKKA